MAAVLPQTVATVNKSLVLPYFHWDWDQGAEGACVGFGTSMMMSVLNRRQAKLAGEKPITHRYNPWWLWDRAKERDPWADTNPGDDNGTSVDAACQALHELGHVRILRGKELPPDPAEGIDAYRWATTVDEMRTCISENKPISIGVDWFENFDEPEEVVYANKPEYWIGRSTNLGRLRGGHCVCVYGASDRRQAFRIKNSWGRSFPLVWLPYQTMQVLLDDWGEACIITDR